MTEYVSSDVFCERTLKAATSNPLVWYWIQDEYAHLFPRLTPVVTPVPPVPHPHPHPHPLTTLDRMLTIGKDIGVIP